MFKLLSVTNRQLCREPFPDRLEQLAQAGIDGIILREKDLPEPQYESLAREAAARCGEALILHSFPEAARKLQISRLHLPLPLLRNLSPEDRAGCSALGTSCHSLNDVREAEDLGCTYVTLGHIFATDCKKGLPPRGLDFLEQVCSRSQLPVYAIGGISAETIRSTREAGAAGACLMSGLMVCDDPARTLDALRDALR